MSKITKKEDIYVTAYKNYGRDLWDFLMVDNHEKSHKMEEHSLAAYQMGIENLRQFSTNELIAIKQMLAITSRRHFLIKPILKIVSSNMRILISVGLFSLIISALDAKEYFQYLIKEKFFIVLFICAIVYAIILFSIEASIIYLEYKKKRFYVNIVLPSMISEVILEKQLAQNNNDQMDSSVSS